jgi:hypothetical protein
MPSRSIPCPVTRRRLCGVATRALGPMWSYSQWAVERMPGLWTPKVKQRATASLNLSLAMLGSALVGHLRYGADLTSSSSGVQPGTTGAVNEDYERTAKLSGTSALLGRLRWSQANDPDGDCDEQANNNHQSTLHRKIHLPMTLNVAQLIKTKAYLDGLGLEFPPDVDYEAEISIRSHRRGGTTTKNKKMDALTEGTVAIWKKCLLNDPNAPRGLYRACIRSAAYEKAGARD